MRKDDKGLEVQKGDKIKVQAQGITVTGTVTGDPDWHAESGWYIEIKDANVPGGYSYWKQRGDGGRIVELNGKTVTSEAWEPQP